MSNLIGPVIDIAIVAALVYSCFSGAKRGMVLIGLELVSFTIATIAAFTGYHLFGALVKTAAHVTAALGNITAFIMLWVITEVACALIIRFAILPHLTKHLQLSRPNQIGGGLLNAAKTAAIVTLGLILFAGLPITAGTKRPVTNAWVPKHMLGATGRLPDILAAGIGRDLNDSLNFFTISSEPESEERINLGYTTTNVSVDEKAEADMLVLLNRERTTRGLLALTLNTKARAVARAYSTDMFARGYFSHISIEGKTPFDRMRAGDVRFGSAGENLALAPTLQLAHDGLMKSPGHRANILSPDYRTVGIGIIDGGPFGLMVTQDFTD